MMVTAGIYICMNLAKALRDRWVQGQLVLLAGTGAAGPVLGGASPWSRASGIVLLLLGLSLAAWSARTLGAGLTPEPEPPPEAQLIRSGPYRFFRHPIYTGVIAGVTGWTLLWSSWLAGIGVWLVLAVFFHAKAEVEERWLRARFPEYGDYMRQVPRKLIW
jgi:protein-S-isoprenylcysteine O-methyltransferase Ste14